MIEKKYFDGLLNGDDAEEFVKENEFTNAINVRFGSTDDGKTGWFENIKGNTLISNALPAGTNTCIGTCIDEDQEAIIWFNHNENGTSSKDGIYVYFNSTNVIKKVLTEDQVDGGLNFSGQIQARVVGDQLFWVDGINEFRRINYKAAIKSNDGSFDYKYSYPASGIKQSSITVIRKPPQFALDVNKASTSQVANFIKDEAFKFSYFYTYKDGEQSVLAPWSKLMDYNFNDDTFDTIKVYIPSSESIDQDVQKVSLVVRFEGSKKCFVIKEFSADVDTAAISDHNTLSSSDPTKRLTLNFYNNQNGIALDDAYSVKPFDSVPLAPKTYESARNRNFIANYTQGYDAPSKTSLSVSVSSVVSSTDTVGRWWKLTLKTGAKHYFLDVHGVNKEGFYEVSTQTTDVFPSTIAYSPVTFTFIGAGAYDVIMYYGATNVSYFNYAGSDSIITGGGLTGDMARVPTKSNTAIIKSDASYQLGVVFYDFARRKCGVVTNDSCRISTPDRTLADINNRRGIDWSLSNSAALSEIPSWATHYAVVATDCLKTRYFIQHLSDLVFYIDKTSAGVYDTSTHNASYTTSRAGIAIGIKGLFSNNLGYTFNKGDICKLYLSGQPVYSLPIIAQEGDYIICQNFNVGISLNITDSAKIEIYTPKKTDFQEFFYEHGDFFSINNPGTNSRTYSVTSGRIEGDVWVVQRTSGATTYSVEAMSPNDKFYQNWFTDAGTGTYIVSVGQQPKRNYIRFSNKYIPGTANNGLCTYDALDEQDVPIECGPINKLQLTSKTKEDGTVLLAICHYECASIYLGESQLVSQYGNSFIARADGVIGTINVLKGSFGTVHPESVALFRGIVMWWDAFNGVVVQYASNGLFPVSSYKMNTFFKRMGKSYINAGGTANFFGGFDPTHEEYLLSSSFTVGSSSTFPTTSSQNRLSVFDGSQATYSYKLGADKWVTKYNYIPENIVSLGTKLFTFKGGQLYVHGTGAYNNFYGTQYDSVISFPSNSELNRTKVYFNLSVEANRPPDNTYVYCSRPEEQITTLLAADFEEKEGVYYAPIYRDRLSPNIAGDYNQKMMAGDWMRSTAMNFQLHFSGPSKLELKFINLNYRTSLGQKT